MANISRLSRLVGGIQRQVDLSTNTLVVGDITVGGGSGTNLTKTILDRLLSTQDGSHLDATYHYHNDTDTPYTRLDGSKKDIQAASDDVGTALSDLDDNKISKAGTIAFTGNQAMGTHKFTGLAAGTTAGDSVRYEQVILASGANAFGADQSMGSHKLTNVTDPTSAQDAATKNYVDLVALGLSPKKAVRVASTANVVLASALINGATMDGITLATGDRVLLKDQTAPAENGIYDVVASGAAARSTDMDSLSPIDEVNKAWVPVQLGTQAGRVYIQYGVVATLGTDAVTFEFYNPLAALTGGDMIVVSGSNIAVDLAAVSGLESSNPGNAAGQLRVKLEASNPSLKITGSNELGAKLDAAGAIVTGAGGLAVAVDGTTIEISTDALRVKDGGISLAKLAANAADDSKIRLANAGYLRARNAANSADINVLRVNSSDVIEFASIPQAAGTPSNANDLVNKAYADSLASGTIAETAVAGESFAANTTFAVRWAVSGETAGRLYKADDDATSTDKFHVCGLLKVGTALSAGDPCSVTKFGSLTQASSDTPFSSGDIGKPVYLTTTGAWSVTASGTASHANVIIGYVKTTTVMDVKSLQIQGVN